MNSAKCNDPRATLTRWRMDSLLEESKPDRTRAEGHAGNKWRDEQSRTAESLLKGRRIDLLWGYDELFGDDEFKVVGLRLGGIGVVYFVESMKSGKRRVYAAKTLASFLKSDYLDLSPSLQEKTSKAFLEETLSWLEMGQHPHIVSVHRLENIVHPEFKRNIPFVFSEFVPRGNLKGYLKEKGRLTLGETIVLGIQLCDGLTHAYEHGLKVHLDLKPENIMVYDDGFFKVTDFSANVIGTPGYMSPEQVASWWKSQGGRIGREDLPVDQRADQFAVGLIMLEVYLGFLPFTICRESCWDESLAEKYIDKGVVGEVDKSLPGSLVQVLTRLLSSNPGDRYPDLLSLKKKLIRLHEEEFGVYEEPKEEEDDSAEWWFQRARAYRILKRYSLSEIPWNNALERYRLLPDSGFRESICRVNLGDVYFMTGRFEEAEEAFHEALRGFRRDADAKLYQGYCTGRLGMIYGEMRRFRKAEKTFRNALDIYRDIPGSELEIAKCIQNFGIIYRETGRFEEANESYNRALQIFLRRPGTEVSQATCFINIGDNNFSLDRFNKAEASYKEALRIFRRIPGTDVWQARCILCLGRVYRETKRYYQAESTLEKALKMYCDIQGTKHDQANCMTELALYYRQVNNKIRARELALKALGLFKSFSHKAAKREIDRCERLLKEIDQSCQ